MVYTVYITVAGKSISEYRYHTNAQSLVNKKKLSCGFLHGIIGYQSSLSILALSAWAWNYGIIISTMRCKLLLS